MEKMPRKGTKKRSPNQRSVRRLGSWTPEEFEIVQEKARTAGYTTLSDYIHDRTLGYKPPHHLAIKQLDQLLLQIVPAFNNLNQIAKIANTQQDVPTKQVLAEIKEELLAAANHIKGIRKASSDDDT